jgi:hypothetical protein
MANPAVFVYIARPDTRVRVKNLFDAGSVKALLENPGSLRYAGWDLETRDTARIVKGEYLEVSLGDLKTIQLYEDGMLLARAKADEEFLAWGSRSGEGFEKRPRMNPLALVEVTYSFVDLYRRVLEHCDPLPETCSLQVRFHNTVRSEERLYLNPYGLETVAHMTDMTRYRAPDDNGEIQVTVPTSVLRTNAPRAAYLLVERIYLWFGVPTNQIPYVSGADSDRVVDVDTLRRGGKAAQSG